MIFLAVHALMSCASVVYSILFSMRNLRIQKAKSLSVRFYLKVSAFSERKEQKNGQFPFHFYIHFCVDNTCKQNINGFCYKSLGLQSVDCYR